MPKLPEQKFYDLKDKKFFTTKEYEFVSKKNKKKTRTVYFIVAEAPSKTKSYRIVSKDFYKENK